MEGGNRTPRDYSGSPPPRAGLSTDLGIRKVGAAGQAKTCSMACSRESLSGHRGESLWLIRCLNDWSREKKLDLNCDRIIE